jgi:hypothetical protein
VGAVIVGLGVVAALLIPARAGAVVAIELDVAGVQRAGDPAYAYAEAEV